MPWIVAWARKCLTSENLHFSVETPHAVRFLHFAGGIDNIVAWSYELSLGNFPWQRRQWGIVSKEPLTSESLVASQGCEETVYY